MEQSLQIENSQLVIIGLYHRSLSLKFHKDPSSIDRNIGS